MGGEVSPPMTGTPPKRTAFLTIRKKFWAMLWIRF